MHFERVNESISIISIGIELLKPGTNSNCGENPQIFPKAPVNVCVYRQRLVIGQSLNHMVTASAPFVSCGLRTGQVLKHVHASAGVAFHSRKVRRLWGTINPHLKLSMEARCSSATVPHVACGYTIKEHVLHALVASMVRW